MSKGLIFHHLYPRAGVEQFAEKLAVFSSTLSKAVCWVEVVAEPIVERRWFTGAVYVNRVRDAKPESRCYVSLVYDSAIS
jgi:hypothetical protein